MIDVSKYIDTCQYITSYFFESWQ